MIPPSGNDDVRLSMVDGVLGKNGTASKPSVSSFSFR
jgi:hypothetical protein